MNCERLLFKGIPLRGYQDVRNSWTKRGIPLRGYQDVQNSWTKKRKRGEIYEDEKMDGTGTGWMCDSFSDGLWRFRKYGCHGGGYESSRYD